MIEFTIKTLDSNNHHFSVDDEITVQQLKEKVREQMGIEINLQRLIFCGRVLQDEKRLSEYDVNGKVVHLVQRAPPSPENRSNAPTTTNTTSSDGPVSVTNANMQQQIRRLMALAGPPDIILEQQQAISMSPTTGRLEFIRRMIAEIKTSLAFLRAHIDGEDNRSSPASSEVPVEQMDNEPTSGATHEEPEPQLDENGDEAPDPIARAQNVRRRSYRAIRALRARHTRPRDFAQLIEELEALQEQFAPYRATYVRVLRAANNPEPPQYTEEERASTQRTVDMVSDIMHSFAHAYHAISDINFQVGQRNPRLTSESTVVRHPIPMQAHINVVQSNRRAPQPQQQQPQAQSAQPVQSAQPPQPAQPVQSPLPAQQPQSEQIAQPAQTEQPAQSAQSTQSAQPTQLAQSTQSAQSAQSVQSTQATQQQQPAQQQESQPQPQQPQPQGSEGSNANGNGNGGAPATQTSANAAENNTNSQGNQGSQATAHAGRNRQPTVNINIQPDPITYQVEIETRVPIAFPLENVLLNGLTNAVNSSQEQNQQGQGQNQAGQAAQANRRQVLLDFENLFRGLSQSGGLGGVEVVMSMEEIPHGGALGVGTIVSGSNNNGGATAPAGAQQPSGDGGVFIAPMPWGGAPSADLLQNIVSSVIRQGLVPGVEGVTLHIPQGQGQVQQIQVPVNAMGQAVIGPTVIATGAQPNQDQATHQNSGTQPSLHLRRATTTTRAQAVTLATIIYDRFLQCESPHARRRLQRRREQHQQQLAAQERLRAERIVAQNIEYLMQRVHSINDEHMTIIVRLLSSAPSQESWLNALLVTVARHIFLSEPLQSLSGDPVLIPHEFSQLRILLRNYVQNMFSRLRGDETESTFVTGSDFFVHQFAEFINNMHTISPIRENYDPFKSIHSLMRSRLPAVLATVMSEAAGEMYANRFYAVFSRLFTDFCTLVSNLCVNGDDGLRLLFRTFMSTRMQYFDESIQGMMTILSNAILEGLIPTLGTHYAHVQHHLVRREEVIVVPPTDTITIESEEPTPMEVSPPNQPREEPMQTSASISPPVANDADASKSASTTSEESPELSANVSLIHASTSTVPTAPPAPVHTVTSSTAPHSPVSSPSRIKVKKEKSEPATPTRNASDQNLRFVPPLMILQHWGEEWVPVFTRDQQNQRPEAQEPYSDAYLSGMPSRKRRCVRQSRPPTTLDGFMNESVREAANDRSSTTDNSSIRIAFREHMRNMARQRASSSEDYDPTRYTSAARFLNASRQVLRTTTKPQPQENGNGKQEEE